MKLHSIVVPAYNEVEVIQDTFECFRKTFIDSPECNFEFIFVNDGSKDGTSVFLDRFCEMDSRFRVIHLSRNFGHQVALTAGIENASGATVSVIDADLQDPPEVILKFIDLWKQGYEVVYGVRVKRNGESAFKKLSASIYYRLLKKLSKQELPVDVGDFRLLDRKVAEAYKQCREHHRYFRGLVAWIGYKQIGVSYVRKPRLKGKTKYNIFKMLQFASDGFTSFSFWPLRLASYFGFVTAITALLGILYILYGKLNHQTIQGWASVMVVTLVLSSVQLFSVGMIGEYLGRMFEEVRARPLYFIDRKVGFGP